MGPGPAAEGFVRAEETRGNYALSGNGVTIDVKQGGKVIGSIQRGPTDGRTHSAYTFTPDGQTVISGGGSGNLDAYYLNGQKLGTFVGHEGDIWAATPSPDGRYLVSGSADLAACYVAAAFVGDFQAATLALINRLETLEPDQQTALVMRVLLAIFGDTIEAAPIDSNQFDLDSLYRLVRIACRVINPADDNIHPSGITYSFDDRDRAEQAAPALPIIS